MPPNPDSSIVDDYGAASFAAPLERHRLLLERRAEPLAWGSRNIDLPRYLDGLRALVTMLSSRAHHDLRSELEKLFTIESATASALLTGYFEPLVRVRRTSGNGCTRAIYRCPSDLALQSLSREAIDSAPSLAGRGLEIAWGDPLDIFLMQVQGSGTIEYDDGSQLHLNYAGKNGHPYVSIGKTLEQIIEAPITLPRLVSYLRTLSPAALQEALNKNPSYVFFKESPQRAVTTLGVSAEPRRTIATDSTVLFKGGVGILTFQRPVRTVNNDWEFRAVSRLILDQDTGGAITGPERIDLFVGSGDAARDEAGVMRHPATLHYLVPKE